MALTSKISEYDTRWPDMFNSEKAHLEGVFGTSRHANLLIYNRYWLIHDGTWLMGNRVPGILASTEPAP